MFQHQSSIDKGSSSSGGVGSREQHREQQQKVFPYFKFFVHFLYENNSLYDGWRWCCRQHVHTICWQFQFQLESSAFCMLHCLISSYCESKAAAVSQLASQVRTRCGMSIECATRITTFCTGMCTSVSSSWNSLTLICRLHLTISLCFRHKLSTPQLLTLSTVWIGALQLLWNLFRETSVDSRR